jgi:hypothetical protein
MSGLDYQSIQGHVRRRPDELALKSNQELRESTYPVERLRSGLRRAEIAVHRDELEPGVLRVVVQGMVRVILWPSYAVALSGFRRLADGHTHPLLDSDTYEFD